MNQLQYMSVSAKNAIVRETQNPIKTVVTAVAIAVNAVSIIFSLAP